MAIIGQMQRFNYKFDRTNFFLPSETFSKNGEVNFDYDLGSSYFHLFKTKLPPRRYQLEKNDIGRPDIISMKAYGAMDYWWILMKVNNIIDPFDELIPELVILVPDIKDIQTWYKEVTLIQSKDERDSSLQRARYGKEMRTI